MTNPQSSPPARPRLFIGSSSEGKDVARNLQVELGDKWDVERWDQGGVFEPSGYTLDSLLSVAQRVDFAVLIATPDDTIISRGETQATVRDNIMLEFGLFAGALGRERTFLLATTNQLKFPTDILGLTRLPYQNQSNPRAALNGTALALDRQFTSRGIHSASHVHIDPRGGEAPHADALAGEIALLCSNAAAQGWLIKTNTSTTLRLVSPRGRTHTFSKQRPRATRIALRTFVKVLRSSGLRVNVALRRPIEDSVF